MKCKYPIDLGNGFFGCGQCLPCRINKKRELTARCLLEHMMHPLSVFATLTYNDDTVPINEDGEQSLQPKDIEFFLRRYRRLSKHWGPTRYFLCGEYGDKSERAHYHAIFYGVPPEAEKWIHDAWNSESYRQGNRWLSRPLERGFTMVGLLNPDRAAYICGYTTKKLTKAGDDRLRKRHPEFARWSRGRGKLGSIGDAATPWLASSMKSAQGRKMLSRHGDVWREIRIDGKVYPLSRYLRMRLRRQLGLSQDAYERAEQLGHIDKETGEIIEPEPMPEYYGPWHDPINQNLPAVIYGKKAQARLELPEVIKRAEKVERRYSKTAPSTTEV